MAKNNGNMDFDITKELGQTGLERYSGLVYEEFLPELSGMRGIKVYREMSDNDPVIGAVLFAVDMLIRGLTWNVVPYSNENIDLENADFIESCMNDMGNTWEDLISEILSMIIYGWSYHEIVYKVRNGEDIRNKTSSKYNDGLIGWSNINIRSQDTLYNWQFGEHGSIKGMRQLAPPFYDITYIPIEKSLLFRTSTRKNNPEGRSMLRNAYRPWYFKKNMETIEGIGVERDLAGLPIALVPPELLSVSPTPQETSILNTIKKIVRNVRRDEQEGIIFPLVYDDNGNKLYDFQLLSSGGKRNFDTNTIINRYDQRIAMVILADFILLGHENIGSYSLSVSKNEIFAVSLEAWSKMISAVFNNYAIPRIFKLNNKPMDRLPCIQASRIHDVNLKDLGDFIQKISGAGFPLFPDDALEKYIREVAKFPPKQEEM